MKNEIERKFFVKKMPDVSGAKPLQYERYFLERGKGREIRISKINDAYVYEEKSEVSVLERTREKRNISKEEFDHLKQNASEAIIRERYNVSENPNIAIQVYHGRFEGLVRAEVEFDSEDEARAFTPLPWMGEEMTHLPIARDSRLLELAQEEFLMFLKKNAHN